MTRTANPIELHMAFERLQFETGFDVRAVIAERDRYKAALQEISDVDWDGPAQGCSSGIADEALA